jgi:ATP-dependent DNA helicase RecG
VRYDIGAPRHLVSRHNLRPAILFPLFKPVTGLPGVGKQIARLIEKLTGGPLVADLLWHLPTGLVDRKLASSIATAPEAAVVTLKVTVDRHIKGLSGRVPYKVRVFDPSGYLHLVFFNARAEHLQKLLPTGAERIVSGRLDSYQGERQITHPDYVVSPAELADVQGPEPVYPLTTGLTPKPLLKAIRAAVALAPELPEWLDRSLVKRESFPAWRDALTLAHSPHGEAELSAMAPARRRLAYDELLANQLALGLVREHHKRLAGRPLAGDGHLAARLIEALPYQLTGAQRMALAEISADLKSEHRMLRLLQGDVGSGKTVVALLAMLHAVEAGAQAALMAPTEILARQHFATIAPLAAAAGLRIALLTGRDKGKAREALLAELAAGALPLIVGTHALFQEDVAFRDLALAVIDEQHRFGVHQRLQLASKGKGVDVLVMTATPIPRSLMLTAYGDLDVSRLTEKPPGRQPIDTRALPMERLEEVIEAARRAIKTGARIYWVCPLIEESETVDLANAVERRQLLEPFFPGRVGLVHGKMKAAEKDRAMEQFMEGALDILVATTVIEVGVDVPEASVMVIEHAERFGLAQLHQLRGRVGRGSARSSCLLVYQAPLGEAAKARLKILRESEDGFRIAEEDLRLRGAGEVLGTRQSGMPEFRLADLAVHEDLLAIARDEAKLILSKDPDLAAARAEPLRVLLYLFERDAAVRFLRSG